jgi:hypothetical protein
MPLMARVERELREWRLLRQHPEMVMVRLRGNTECLMLAYRP